MNAAQSEIVVRFICSASVSPVFPLSKKNTGGTPVLRLAIDRASKNSSRDCRLGSDTLHGIPHAGSDAGRVEADFGQLLRTSGVTDQAIGHAQANDVAGWQAMADGVLDHGGAETILQRMIFYRQHRTVAAEHALEHHSIEWFAETGVDDFDVDAIGLQ